MRDAYSRGRSGRAPRPASPQDHYAKLVQIRVSERAKAAIAEVANQRGLSEAAFLRDLIYQHLGLTPPRKDNAP